MTDLREKVRGIVACAKDDMVSLDDATDAIMKLVQPVCGDLHQTLKSALMDYADALWNEGDPDPDAAAEALARRVQPVVTDEMRKAAFEVVEGSFAASRISVAGLEELINDALTAALPHAVTRDDVIEKLAVEADEFDLELGVEAELHGVDQKTPLLGIADWIRSRKGGA